jgi:cytochrome c oxidase assembly protein subunit 15
MNSVAPYNALVHRFAMATAVVVLLPIVFGALVTSLGAGMAFLDWPTSDGENMFAYPWLKDLAAGRTDKFVEHGHRLTGIVIGLFSIGLVVAAWTRPTRRSVRVLAAVVLGAVIFQGLLGGVRVIQNRDVLAMLHGSLAAVVFTLICVVVLFAGRSWDDYAPDESSTTQRNRISRLKPLAIMTMLLVAVQYLLGGFVRHLGTTLFEHIGFAVLVLVFVGITAIGAIRSRQPILRKNGLAMLAVGLTQVGLGLGAFATKYGFPPSGYVAIQHSTPQVLLRTSHTVVGMLLLMTSVTYVIRLFHHDLAGAIATKAISAEGGVQ